MATYDALGHFLKKNGARHIPMTFREVESVIGRKLPPSAYRHRPWWANEERGHSHAKAWLGAGYQTEQVDMAAKKLIFKRASNSTNAAPREVGESAREYQPTAGTSDRHPMIGALKGTFTIEDGWDLTKPALDPQELEEWEANLDRTADMIAEGLRGKRR